MADGGGILRCRKRTGRQASSGERWLASKDEEEGWYRVSKKRRGEEERRGEERRGENEVGCCSSCYSCVCLAEQAGQDKGQ